MHREQSVVSGFARKRQSAERSTLVFANVYLPNAESFQVAQNLPLCSDACNLASFSLELPGCPVVEIWLCATEAAGGVSKLTFFDTPTLLLKMTVLSRSRGTRSGFVGG